MTAISSQFNIPQNAITEPLKTQTPSNFPLNFQTHTNFKTGENAESDKFVLTSGLKNSPEETAPKTEEAAAPEPAPEAKTPEIKESETKEPVTGAEETEVQQAAPETKEAQAPEAAVPEEIKPVKEDKPDAPKEKSSGALDKINKFTDKTKNVFKNITNKDKTGITKGIASGVAAGSIVFTLFSMLKHPKAGKAAGLLAAAASIGLNAANAKTDKVKNAEKKLDVVK